MRLDGRTAELISIGASIAANCQPCLEYHVRATREAGTDDQDLAEAAEVGKMVRRGAAAKMDQFAASFRGSAASGSTILNEGCGCRRGLGDVRG